VIKENLESNNGKCSKLIVQIADMSHYAATNSLVLDKHTPTCTASSNRQLYIHFFNATHTSYIFDAI